MKTTIKLATLLTATFFFTQCGINRQVKQAKVLGDCRYALVSTDSILIAGYNVREFSGIQRLEDINPLKYPRVAAGLLRHDIPFTAIVNLAITNPNAELAAINQFEYMLLLADSELATGTINQRIEVPPGGGSVTVPIPVNANAYALLASSATRSAFIDLVRNLSGDSRVGPSKATLKIKPTLMLGNKLIKYPGYVTVDKELSRDKLITQPTSLTR